ncbi:MAG: alanine racemase [Pseudomonadota bacterium]|jgi:alanine racemase|nr:alanine racemase [Deltaproteobacteria bacterium]MDI9541685.1 alanine racemase [Pseudomonadota bacterium]HRT45086.1 alanine racemase [Desulfomonilia bacterium]
MRPTRVEIDLCAIKGNLEAIRAWTKTKVMMAIKADAYGHGAQVVGRFVQEHRLADMLGVSCIEEGIHLREAGISLPILVFGLINNRDDCDTIFSHRLTPTLVDRAPVKDLVAAARKWNRPVPVHLKTDTGMGRLGLTPDESIALARDIAEVPEIRISGIYTHFPVSDVPGHPFTPIQIAAFTDLIDRLKMHGISTGSRHCANSGAILNHEGTYLDMVRPGILCYGLYPSPEIPKTLKVVPAMALKTAIMFTKRVKKGTGLSYGLTYRAPKDTCIATIPIGYADGFPRSLSNIARVTIQGKTYPVVGRICMDQSLIDLGDDLYPVGQEVTVFGREGITAETLASWNNTIPYEITCNMSRRVPRTYSNDIPASRP